MTPAVLILLAGFAAWGGGAGLLALWRRDRRARAAAAPFPEAWIGVLEKNLPPYRHFPDDLRRQLHRRINVFLAEKSFEGCGGLVVDDAMKVIIAAQACILLLNRGGRCYPRLRSVLVYPSTYVAGGRGVLGGDGDERSARLGESWQSGVVVLAWDSVRQGAVNFEDGHNVTVHEFAHQLDQEDGAADGAPLLGQRSAYASWARVLSKEYERLRRRSGKGRRTVLDAYGATNPAEFFAVATEVFFEKPEQMMKKHADLYGELKGFYKVDPAAWQ